MRCLDCMMMNLYCDMTSAVDRAMLSVSSLSRGMQFMFNDQRRDPTATLVLAYPGIIGRHS